MIDSITAPIILHQLLRVAEYRNVFIEFTG